MNKKPLQLKCRVGEIRRKQGLTRAELAEELDIKSPSAIYKIEKGERFPGIKTAYKIADKLQVKVDDLWFFDE